MSIRLPQHPGVTHYLIHLYDYPATAQKGLDAANRYAKIAPAAPHAQHMPSHIYTRVGYWKESIASNAASVKAAKAEKSVGNYLHAQDYMVYAHLQLAQDQQARAVIDDMIKETDFKATVAAADYALAASPARYAIDRGDWDAASQLSVRPSGLNFAMAISHFARSLGAARSGKPEAAKADIQKLAELRDKLREAKDNYWSEIVDIQRQVAVAWVLHAEGKYDEALKAMSAAADAEDKTEKHVITPGPLAPARELYGFMLLDRSMAKEALAAFEATKAKEPNRFQGYAGAAKAADTLGDKAAARQQLSATRGADGERRHGAAGGCGGEEVSRQQLAQPETKRWCNEGGSSYRRRSSVAGKCAGGGVGMVRSATARGRNCDRAGMDRGGLALPHRSVGQGKGVPLQGCGLRCRGEHLSACQDRLLQLHDRRSR